MNVIIPIATKEPAFEDSEYRRPRPLVEVSGRPLIKWVTECLRDVVENSSYTFPVLESHIKHYNIDNRLKKIFSEEINIVPVYGQKNGAALTVLQAQDYISDEELIILLGDQYIDMDLQSSILERSEVDGLIPVFESTEDTWSYADTKEGRTVKRVAEKKVISSHATAGAYYFSNGLDFVKGAKMMIEKDVKTNGLFYICPVYNELIEMSRKIEIMPINKVEKLSSPEDVNKFESKAKKTNI